MLGLYYWAISGLLLILLELAIHGGVVVFLGGGCLTVAAGIHYGYISDLTTAFLTFFLSSTIYLIILRSFFIRYFEGDSEVQNTDEDVDSLNSVVEVIEEIKPHKGGRVRFRDTTWSAQSDFEIRAGEKAIIIGRNENTWVLRPLE